MVKIPAWQADGGAGHRSGIVLPPLRVGSLNAVILRQVGRQRVEVLGDGRIHHGIGDLRKSRSAGEDDANNQRQRKSDRELDESESLFSHGRCSLVDGLDGRDGSKLGNLKR